MPSSPRIFALLFMFVLAGLGACDDDEPNDPASDAGVPDRRDGASADGAADARGPDVGADDGGANDGGDADVIPFALSFDFASGFAGFTAGFADYPAGMETFYELDSGWREVPGTTDQGFYVQGNNHSDDLFMFLKRMLGPADGVRPGVSYDVSITVRLASNAASGCLGTGGSPGDSVYVKAGASAIEPRAVSIVGDDFLRMNVDKGNQAAPGQDVVNIGVIANGLPCDNPSQTPYVTITREMDEAVSVTASPQGTLWILVGTDSGFESLTGLYYRRVEVRLSPR